MAEGGPAQTETAVFEAELSRKIDEFFDTQKNGLVPGNYEIRVPNRPTQYRNVTESKTSPIIRLNDLRRRGKKEGLKVMIQLDYRKDLTVYIYILRK